MGTPTLTNFPPGCFPPEIGDFEELFNFAEQHDEIVKGYIEKIQDLERRLKSCIECNSEFVLENASLKRQVSQLTKQVSSLQGDKQFLEWQLRNTPQIQFKPIAVIPANP